MVLLFWIYQNTIRESLKKFTMRIVVLSDETSLENRKEIFHRINTSGKPAKEALEKQIEKKPIIKQRVGLEYYTCPNPECEDYLGNRFPKRLVKTSYCECCGQALDWSDEE